MVGLAQLGNSCFLNSTVQSLFLTDDFRSSLTSLQLSPAEMQRFATLRSLQHLFGLLMYCTRTSYSPKAFRAEMPEVFRNGSQQDADEFAKHLLETVHSQWKELQAQRTQQQQQQGTAKRKAEEVEGEGQPGERRLAAVFPLSSERSSPSPPPPASSDATTQPSLHGPIRGGGESSSGPVLLLHSPRPIHLASAPAKPSVLPATTNSPLPTASPSSSSLSTGSTPRAPPPCSPSSSTPPQHDLDPQFGGVVSSCIRCLRCGHSSVKEEAFLELPLPMQQMDDEQRSELHKRIERAQQQAQQPQQPPTRQTATGGSDSQRPPAAAPAAEDSLIPQPASYSSPPSSVAVAKVARALSATCLPDPVLANILAFADVRPAALSRLKPRPTAVTAPIPRIPPPSAADEERSAQALLRLRGLPSSSPSPSASDLSSESSASVSVAGNSFAPSSSSTALAPSTSSSPSMTSSASPAPSPSSPSALLATFLARAVLHTTMQASLLTTLTTLTTAATLAQQQQEEQLMVEKQEKHSVEDKSTALVLYTPPPHLPSTSPSADAALIAPSASASSSASSSSSSSSSSLSLVRMLELYLSPELLLGDNAYECAHCASKQSATLSCAISFPPPHLLIALKRNSYHSQVHSRSKLMTEVVFPAFLRLPSPSTPHAAYALYSVVVHSGLSADSGHYYAIGRRSGALRRRMQLQLRQQSSEEALEEEARGCAGDFCTYNDDSVTAASFATVRQVTRRCPQDVAYLLLYVRVDEQSSQQLEGPEPVENPLLRRLAELEHRAHQDRERKEQAAAAARLLAPLKPASYTPPAEGWTDPDM